MKPLILIGMGGHSKVIADIVSSSNQYKIIGYLDDSIKDYYEKNHLFFDNLNNINRYKDNNYFFIAIGSNFVRSKIFNDLGLPIDKYPILVHQTAVISESVQLGNGTAVMANAVINASTKIGYHSIVNTSAVVEHDNLIGDYVHVSPGATLTGGLSVGNHSQIGAGASIIPNVIIGENTIVGAGSTVIKNIPSNVIAVGSPAKIIKENL